MEIKLYDPAGAVVFSCDPTIDKGKSVYFGNYNEQVNAAIKIALEEKAPLQNLQLNDCTLHDLSIKGDYQSTATWIWRLSNVSFVDCKLHNMHFKALGAANFLDSTGENSRFDLLPGGSLYINGSKFKKSTFSGAIIEDTDLQACTLNGGFQLGEVMCDDMYLQLARWYDIDSRKGLVISLNSFNIYCPHHAMPNIAAIRDTDKEKNIYLRDDLPKDRRILQLADIGDSRRVVTFFNTRKGTYVKAGCFFDKLPAFEEAVRQDYPAARRVDWKNDGFFHNHGYDFAIARFREFAVPVKR